MQIDLAGMIWNALLALPGIYWAMVAANPGPWLIGFAALGLALILKLVELRTRHHRRTRR